MPLFAIAILLPNVLHPQSLKVGPIGHSVPVTQNCLYRWIEGQLSGTVLHEQPERHHGENNDATASTHVLSSYVSGS